MYVQRFIEPVVHDLLATGGVVILEGARSVGKTRLLHQLYEQGRLTSITKLHDPSQLAAARRDTLSWLRSLPQPFAIDEAQLLPDLPLALKLLLDETNDQVRCILTGSAGIGRGGLGGADPLARRAARLTLRPLTEAELASVEAPCAPWSALEQLVHGTPDVTYQPTDARWAESILRGGLPRYRVDLSFRQASAPRRVRDDIGAILGRGVLPGERWDETTAFTVVERVLRNPAGELKVARIAGETELHRATVNRYLDIAEERFLIEELANLQRPVKQSSRATAKAYPADVALSAALLGLTRIEDATDTQLGGLFEALVIQQLRAHLAWSVPGYSLHHWRRQINGRTVEVDAVIQDAEGRLTPVEVKVGERVRTDSTTAIETFAAEYPRRFNRGIVIRGGGAAVPLGDDIWSLPFSALMRPQHWQGLTPGPLHNQHEAVAVTTPAASGPRTAGIFMSYAHADAEATYGRTMRRFAEDVVIALDGIYDKQVQLFYDTKDGVWGEELWARLDRELLATTFFLPFITPKYLRSEGCVHEFTRFSEAVAARGQDGLLLPLIWIEPPAFREAAPSPLVQRLRELRYLDVTRVRKASHTSQEYAEVVELVAEQLSRVIDEREASAALSLAIADEAAPEDRSDLLDALATVEEMAPRLQDKTERWGAAFQALAPRLSELFTGMDGLTATQMKGRVMASAQRLKDPSTELTELSDDLARDWDNAISALRFSSQAMAEVGQPFPEEVVRDTEALADELGALDFSEVEDIAQQLPIISALLTPTSRSIIRAINTLRQIESSARAWVEQERGRQA